MLRAKHRRHRSAIFLVGINDLGRDQGLKIIKDHDLLIELSFGEWEGHTMDEIELDHPGVDRERDAAKWDFCPPGDGAESYEMLASRIDRFLETVTGPSVIVAHGGVIRALFNRIGGIDGNAAAMIDVPQDRILRIENGRIGWL